MGRPALLTDTEILQRVRPLFVNLGIRARTRDISRTVGLTWGALARRFGNKRALFDWAMHQPSGCFAGLEREVAGASLPAMLELLAQHLAYRWPVRLQYCLAGPGAGEREEAAEHTVRWLAALLQQRAARGDVRADLPFDTLAATVLAALLGDAADGFVRSQRTPGQTRDVVETLARLLAPPALTMTAPMTSAPMTSAPMTSAEVADLPLLPKG